MKPFRIARCRLSVSFAPIGTSHRLSESEPRFLQHVYLAVHLESYVPGVPWYLLVRYDGSIELPDGGPRTIPSRAYTSAPVGRAAKALVGVDFQLKRRSAVNHRLVALRRLASEDRGC
ncbi:hypothetical protein XU18_3815 [Perkinsela sp. CCAP 1560/4]|nr:hypothetical protein XU18_3815 [Perkinsela sp. CCAP 1560/4]|eukprot:KNH05087.1 hypothetical protein XU18_3815 [Perkinsela sp. CCAP 1560/4]